MKNKKFTKLSCILIAIIVIIVFFSISLLGKTFFENITERQLCEFSEKKAQEYFSTNDEFIGKYGEILLWENLESDIEYDSNGKGIFYLTVRCDTSKANLLIDIVSWDSENGKVWEYEVQDIGYKYE